MYRIEGNGTWTGTKIWKSGAVVENWTSCVISIDESACMAWVDTNPGSLSRVVLTGIYMLIGDGEFSNTKFIVGEDVFRGIQSISIVIEANKDTITCIRSVFLPNIIEGED